MSSFHPSITTYCGHLSHLFSKPISNGLIGKGRMKLWNLLGLGPLFPHDVPNDVHNLFSVCFFEKFILDDALPNAVCIVPRNSNVSLSHVFGQVFPPYVCSQCSHLTYVYIPYVLQNAPNPVPNKPQILSHKLCLKCSLT